jgi:transposase-like protein
MSITENSKMGDKRKKVVVTMEEKLRAMQRLESGVTAKNIASELGVGKSTVGDWKKKIKQKLKSGVLHKLVEVE